MVATSVRRKKRSWTRMLTARRLSSDVNRPLTLRLTVSGPACTMPEGATTFCCCRLVSTACWSTPSPATCWVEKLRWMTSSCTPSRSTLPAPGIFRICARLLGIVAELAEGEAVGGQRIDVAEHVAELVVEERPLHVGRQVGLDVADLVAHLDPDARDVAAGRVVLEVDEDGGLARARVALGEIERAQLLQLALDAVGDLVGHLLDRGARPARIDDHRLDGEGGILLAAEPRVGQAAGQHDHQHQVPDEGAVAQRPVREVEAVHGVTFTTCPGVRL